MVRALESAAEIAGLGAGDVDLSEIPVKRVQVLARQSLSSDAAILRRMSEPRRWATLVATAGVLRVSAVDDAPDLFSVLIAAKLIGPAARAKAKDRMRSLPQLRRASVTLAAAAKAMLGCAEGSCDPPRTCSPTLTNCAAGARGGSIEVYILWPCQRSVQQASTKILLRLELRSVLLAVASVK